MNTTHTATHTPGPWRVHTRLTGRRYNGHPVHYFSVEHTTETRDCFIATEIAPTALILPGEGGERFEPNDEGQANARLIAAAPDLLEALVKIHANAAESPEWSRNVTAPLIARAKGQA